MNGNIHVQFLGEEVAATSPPYPTTQDLNHAEKRGVQAARNGPSEDSKCWQRIELGIHGLKS